MSRDGDVSTFSTLPQLGPPPRIGRYEIVGRLATGGMAEVYLARVGEISGFQTLVVVKRILPHLASDPQFIEMFLDEARIAARLDHPNVVRIVEVGRSGTEYFLAMELVQGESMATILRRGVKVARPLGSQLAALVVSQGAAGLHHAHTLTDVAGSPLDIVHRDISPQNLLVSFDGAVKIIDFGVARAMGRVSHTNTGGVKGKFGYMSPEQARGEMVDARSDIFALGVILWEAVTGRRLFKRDSDLATLRAIVDEPHPKPSEFAAVARSLEEIVMCALSKDREERFGTAAELQLALEGYLYSESRVGIADLSVYLKDVLGDRLLRWKEAVREALERGTGKLTPRPETGTSSADGLTPIAHLGSRSASPVGFGAPSAVPSGIQGAPSGAARPPARGWRLGLAVAGILGVLALGIVQLVPREEPPPAPASQAQPLPSPPAALPAPPAADPAGGMARLFVSVEPKGARVLVDGVVRSESTPIVLRLPPGLAELRIEKEGFEPVVESIELHADQEKVVDRRLSRAPAPGTGKKPSRGSGARSSSSRKRDLKPNPF